MTKTFITSDHRFCLEVIEMKVRAEISLLELGRYLSLVRKGKKWQVAWTSYEEFLWEMKMSRAKASKIERIWSLFVDQWCFDVPRLAGAGGWSHLAEVLPMVKDKKSAEHWVEMASLMKDRTDLRRSLHEAKHGTDMLACRHEDCYYLKVCRDCGLRENLFEDELINIKNEKNNGLVVCKEVKVEKDKIAL